MLYAGKAQTVVPEVDWLTLVQSIGERDQHALHALYERTHHLVYTLIVRLTKDRETAEELTVDVFHDVWRRASTYDPESGTVIAWIMNQARSRAIDRLRFEQRKKRVNPYPNAPGETSTVGPQEALDATDQGRVLREALAVLSADERQAIEAAFFSGLTYAEVAGQLDAPLGTVKTRVRTGLGKLRQALSESEP